MWGLNSKRGNGGRLEGDGLFLMHVGYGCSRPPFRPPSAPHLDQLGQQRLLGCDLQVLLPQHHLLRLRLNAQQRHVRVGGNLAALGVSHLLRQLRDISVKASVGLHSVGGWGLRGEAASLRPNGRGWPRQVWKV